VINRLGISVPSQSDRLPEHWVDGQKELAQLPNEANQGQFPFDRIQMGELHLGVMQPGVAGQGSIQSPGLTNGDHLITLIVQ